MKWQAGRRVAVAFALLLSLASCTSNSAAPAPDPGPGPNPDTHTACPVAPPEAPVLQLPDAPSPVFRGLSFGCQNLVSNPLGAENVRVTVAFVQEWLGHTLASDPAGTSGLKRHGVYDAATRNAVKRFQEAKGITDNGFVMVGKETWTALCDAVKRCENRYPYGQFLGVPFGYEQLLNNEIGAEDVGADVACVQIFWNHVPAPRRGIAASLILEETGTFDPATGQAVRAFQEASDGRLEPDGQVGALTWDELTAYAGEECMA